MIRFQNDYSEGAHPKVLERLARTNLEQTAGYGMDPYCGQAAGLIRKLCESPEADVHFLVGGTQVNLTVLAAGLRPHQGVLAADTGHIAGHETGAVEATGHKVLTLPGEDGKLTAEGIEAVCKAHYGSGVSEHTVQPGMVYISDSTELGTVYHKAELTAISEACRRNGLLLYLDGARLGYALCSEENDLGLPALARLCDAFTIGGTKVGALFGEALVLSQGLLKKDFRYIMKQRGGMLAKGRLLGLQFLALLEDGLYFDISRHANAMALRIREAFEQRGFGFVTRSGTNQQFPILPDRALSALEKDFVFQFEGKISEDRNAVRFCTSWATREEDVEQLVNAVRRL